MREFVGGEGVVVCGASVVGVFRVELGGELCGGRDGFEDARSVVSAVERVAYLEGSGRGLGGVGVSSKRGEGEGDVRERDGDEGMTGAEEGASEAERAFVVRERDVEV